MLLVVTTQNRELGVLTPLIENRFVLNLIDKDKFIEVVDTLSLKNLLDNGIYPVKQGFFSNKSRYWINKLKYQDF